MNKVSTIMWNQVVIVAVVLVHLTSSASVTPCPKTCTCLELESGLKATCLSTKFLNKINTNKHMRSSITHLELINASITEIDPRLDYLENLRSLDLSSNNLIDLSSFPKLPQLKILSLSNCFLKDSKLNFAWLPENVENLDLSHNYLTRLPKDWSMLKHIKILHLHNNPIDCSHNSLSDFESFLQTSASFPERIVCHSPDNLSGATLSSVITDRLLNSMMGDQAAEDEDEENEFLRTDDKATETKTDTKVESEKDDDFFEGSGDEGSGAGDEFSIPKACVMNCSTIAPILSNETDSKSNTSVIEAVKENLSILFEDIFGGKEEENATTLHNKEEHDKEKEAAAHTDKDTEHVPTNITVVGELERAQITDGHSAYTYYLIGLVLLLMLAVIVFIVIKKRTRKLSRKRRGSQTENGICEEMKPLDGKYTETSSPHNNGNGFRALVEASEEAEKVALMEANNGKVIDEDAEEPELRRLDTLTPQPERVTITAATIPDSIPKTPQLVHRELNSNGEIVTKPL